MSLFGFLQPKWQHADPAVRLTALSGLRDQATLGKIAADDPDENVRIAALARLTDQTILADLATGTSPVSVPAAVALNDARLLLRVAREAANARAREAAVGRIEDPVSLKKIADQDPDADVRMQARSRALGAAGMHRVLKHALAKLQIAEQSAAAIAEYCGSLDDVCGALLRDRRFHVNGVLTATEAADANGGTTASGAEPEPVRVIELLARKAEAAPSSTSGYFQIRVWRAGADAFQCAVQEHNPERRHDVEAWSRSSSGV